MGKTFLVVGLGNPGSQYEQTRHNIGFAVVEKYAAHLGCMSFAAKWDGEVCEIRSRGNRILLLKPMTYMNRSGNSVARFVSFYKIDLDNIVIIHDDLDLMPGRLKITQGGGAGGHNGIRSLIERLGSKDFVRLKFGIGRPPTFENGKIIPVERYVLGRFSQEELQVVDERLDDCVEALDVLIEKGCTVAMNTVNGRYR